MPGVRVDGNDVLAVYAAVRAAVNRARAGQGPTLVECVTYRLEAHTNSDDTPGTATPTRSPRGLGRDPVARFERYLVRDGLLDDRRRRGPRRSRGGGGRRAASRWRRWRHPAPDSLFRYVYTEPTEMSREEQQLLAGELARA